MDQHKTPSIIAALSAQKRLELLVDAVVDYAIFLIDRDGTVASWNKGAQRIKGYAAEEIIGQPYSLFHTSEDRAARLPQMILQTAAATGRYATEAWRVRKDGSRFWASIVVEAVYDDRRELIGFAKVTRDNTQRKQQQEELDEARAAMMQSQKMEAIGQLTAGVAHDFNNLLMVISGSYDLLTRPLDNERRARIVETARRATERGAKLTRQLLAFGQRQPLRPRAHDLNTLIRSFEPMLRRAAGDAVECELNLAPEPVGARVDSQQCEVALLNLVVNAHEAMTGGGRLTVSTGHRRITGRVATTLRVPPGDYAVITVTDTGRGMEPEVRAKAFEPFFTTGLGSGLGLSQVYGFVSQSGGGIDLQSTPGEGTQCSLFLPEATPEAVVQAPSVEPARPAPEPVAAADRTILVVEDNPDVLELAVEMVGSLGFSVLAATDGPSALTLLKKGAPIDLLFTDVVMPKGMNGVELARQARRLNPDLPVLLASGYPASALSAQHGVTDEFAFISKPYRWADFAEKLKTLGVGA